jgi:hypothetical protein
MLKIGQDFEKLSPFLGLENSLGLILSQINR